MASGLPYRGDGRERPAGLALPPERMPLFYRPRPPLPLRALKRWRYVGVFGEAFMLCAGIVRIAGLPQSFWAVWERERRALREHTTLRPGRVVLADGGLRVRDGQLRLDLRFTSGGEPVEVVSDHHGGYIWTRMEPFSAVGSLTIDGETRALRAGGIVDDSAGYYARTTEWEWGAGVGVSADGRALAWNLVTGVHDSPEGSERTVWIAGKEMEVGPVTFRPALDGVAFPDGSELRFAAESVRRRRENLLLVASDYVQPFGTVSGTLPGGIEVAEGYGVMERHRARW
jgi:hypothetical protein